MFIDRRFKMVKSKSGKCPLEFDVPFVKPDRLMFAHAPDGVFRHCADSLVDYSASMSRYGSTAVAKMGTLGSNKSICNPLLVG